MKRTTAIGVGITAVLAACSGGSDATAPELGPVDAAPAAATAEGQISGIHELIAAQSAAWAAKDATAYAATYTEDAEVINPVGGILMGREIVRTQHAFLFNPVTGFFRESTSVWSIRDIEFLTGTTALVKLDVTLSGISQQPPGLPAVEPGTVKTRVVWVAVKNGAGWQIDFQQMTPLPG